MHFVILFLLPTWVRTFPSTPFSEATSDYESLQTVTVGVVRHLAIWVITPCRILSLCRRFGGTCCLRLQMTWILWWTHKAINWTSVCTLHIRQKNRISVFFIPRGQNIHWNFLNCFAIFHRGEG